MSSIFKFRYRERFGMSVSQLKDEPWEAIWEAEVIWSADRKREELEEKKRSISRN